MGSVQSYDECPKCGYQDALYDSFYKTGELYVCCERCGYYYGITIVKDKDGEIVFEKENVPKFEIEEVVPEGGHFTVRKKGAIAYSCGSYQNKEKFTADLNKTQGGLQEATYTEKVDGVWYSVNLITGERKVFPDGRDWEDGKK